MTQPGHVQSSRPDRKFGLVPSNPDKPRLRLAAFLTRGYTGTVPQVIDYASKVTTWPMALNDRLGCCTASDAAHQIEVWTTYGQQAIVTPTDADVLHFYAGSTGYIPGDPSTDQGGNLQDVCAYFRKVGIAGHKAAAFFQVDQAVDAELRAALWLFGGVAIGFGFPSFAMDQFDQHLPWDISGRNTHIEGGHDVLLVGKAADGNYQVVTWGRVQEVTPAFWSEYMAPNGNEAWCRVSLEWVQEQPVPRRPGRGRVEHGVHATDRGAGPLQQPARPTHEPSPASLLRSLRPVSAADKALAAAMHHWLTNKGL
jgi:hypothetical protein